LKNELERLQITIMEQEATIVFLHKNLSKKIDQLASITDEKVE
jgi:hypothetical protein